MRSVDVAGAIGRFLASRRARAGLREGGSRLLADILEALDQERLGGMVKAAVAERMRRVEIAPLLGQTLEAAITEERHVPLVDGIVTWAGRTLDANEDMIRDMVHQRAGWILKLAGLDAKLADAIVDGLRKLTIDMALDPAPSAARQGRGGARPPRRGPALRSRAAGAGSRRGRTRRSRTRRSPTGSAASGRRAAPACSRARATPRPRWPASSARRCANSARRCSRSRGSRRRSTSSPAAPRSASSPPMATASSPWFPTRSAAGTRAPSPTGSKARSAATSNISASTAPWSAAWSASPSTAIEVLT